MSKLHRARGGHGEQRRGRHRVSQVGNCLLIIGKHKPAPDRAIAVAGYKVIRLALEKGGGSDGRNRLCAQVKRNTPSHMALHTCQLVRFVTQPSD